MPAILGALSPLCATVLGWLILNETLLPSQAIGIVVVLCSVFLGQYALRVPHSQGARAAL
ncbi:EamA family transporter [Limimaricola soesokkakensis]|uniref:EamA family transporter n=1 Tax=Limimaricola soesokkakensis TaxID=1343159 RepID=UPI0035130D11